MAGPAQALAAGDPEAVGPALDFLESDPYFFRSGYLRSLLARRLAHVPLGPPQARRAREYVIAVVDGRLHCGAPEVARLAAAVVDNPLRRALRDRLRSGDPRVAERALRVLLEVRRPGLTEDDRDTARDLVLEQVARRPYLTPTGRRQALRLWSPAWEAELRATARRRGPLRAAAKRLIADVERRRTRRRPGP